MSTTPNYAGSANNGAVGLVQAGDISRTSPTSPVTILTPGVSGSRVERLTVTPINTLTASVLRFFIYDGSAYRLYNELALPAWTYSAGTQAPTWTFEAFDTPGTMPILVKAGNTLVATVNDTQLFQLANLTAITNSAQPANGVYFSLVGTPGTGASIAAVANPGANTAYTLTTSPYTMPNPAQVTITSTGNNTGVGFQITGITPTGALLTETVTGPNNGTAYSINIYKYILQVVPNASQSAGYASIGYSTYCGSSIFPLPSKVILTSPGAANGSVFITGSGSNGNMLNEVLAGPSSATNIATSVNTYSSVTSVKVSSTLSASVAVGTPDILSGVSVQAMAADF